MNNQFSSIISRRQMLRLAAAGVSTAIIRPGLHAQTDSAPAQTAKSDAPISVGSDRQLFFDDKLIDLELSKSVTRVVNPPQSVVRVLKPEQPWEEMGFVFYCSVVDDDGSLKLFYGSYSYGTEREKHLCVATSTDGLTWERKRIGKIAFRGSKENNMLPGGSVEWAVILDPHASAEKRYRMVLTGGWPNPETAGVMVGSSADGVEWQIGRERMLPFVPDSQPVPLWDDRIKRYVVYLRGWNPGRVVTRVELDDLEKPWPYTKSEKPHHIWGKDKIPTLRDELPTVMARDEQDPENLHLYTSGVVKYPFAPDTYFAFPAAYLLYKGKEWKPRMLNGNDGPFEVQVATSRDGIGWTRWRQPYVAPGFYDGVNLKLVSMGLGMVRRGPHLYQYFIGWPFTHGGPSTYEKDPATRAEMIKNERGGIYCAMQRLDGFLSMDAAYAGGTLTTKPLIFSGNCLHLNINAAGAGFAKVALLDVDGKPIAGFAESDCAIINDNGIDFAVRWKNGSDVGSLAGKPVRVKLTMRNAKLFALQFGEMPSL